MICNGFKESSVHTQADNMSTEVEAATDAPISMIRNSDGDFVKTNMEALGTDDVEAGFRPDDQMEKLKKYIKHLHRSMAFFGLYNTQSSEEDIGHNKLSDKLRKLLCKKKQIVYQMIVLISMVLFIGRTILSFFIGENSSNFTPLRLTILIWYIQGTLSAAILIKSSHKKFGSQIKACQWCFSNVLPLFTELGVYRGTKSIRRQLLFSIVIGWMFVTFNVTVVSFFLLFEQNSFNKVLISTLVAPLPVNIVTKSIVLVLIAYVSVAWMLSMIYVISMNLILKYSFKLSRQALFDAISKKEDKTNFPQCLYKQRVLHLNISKVVALLDKDFNYCFANWFVTNIPAACLLLYQVIKEENMDTFLLVSYMFWLASSILPVSVTAIIAAITHDAAHSLLDHIYDVSTRDITLGQLGQLNLFLSKLNGSPIGFTVLNFITITKEVLLTVGGLYLTYFFVLWQF